MNTIRNIEGATLVSIGALCAAAIFSLAMQSAHAIAASHHAAANANVPTVVIVAKRMSAEEKAAMRAEMRAEPNAGHVL